MDTIKKLLMALAAWALLVASTYAGNRLAAPAPVVARKMALAVPGPANPVITVDTSGNYVGPGSGTAGSTTVTNDAGNPVPVSQQGTVTVAGGGTAGVPVASVLTTQGISGGTPAPADTAPGDAINSVSDLVTAGVSSNVKGASGTFVAVNVCNEGSVTGWWMCFDQATPDAGGNVGVAPKWMGIRVPSGSCASLNGVRTFSSGLQCYSSATVSTLTTSAAPNFTAETFYR